MSISTKDFTAIAEALNQIRPGPLFTDSGNPASDLKIGETLGWQACCLAVANACSDLNPRFDRARFLATCQGN